MSISGNADQQLPVSTLRNIPWYVFGRADAAVLPNSAAVAILASRLDPASITGHALDSGSVLVEPVSCAVAQPAEYH
jgi:hypothetical protein